MSTLFYSDNTYSNKIYRVNSDPHFSRVSLLLHCDGTNGSTTFIDSSSSPKTLTANGNANISTAKSKFGGSSGLFDGTGDYLSSSYDAGYDLIGSDFTIEGFVYPSTLRTSGTRLISTGGGALAWNSTNGIHVLLQCNGTSNALALQLSNGTGSPITFNSSALALTNNSWQHISACVSGSTAYLSLNGVVESASVAATSRPSTNPVLNIATIPGEAGGNTVAFQGYMDEIRITKGTARYTANFTPPIKSFPNR